MIPDDIRIQAKKAGTSPGQLIYTGKKQVETHITVINYTHEHIEKKICHTLEDIIQLTDQPGTHWICVAGLRNTTLIGNLLAHFNIHPLTAEDILGTGQRPKLEEFDDYIFVSIKHIGWIARSRKFSVSQLSFLLCKNMVITFSEMPIRAFTDIQEKMFSRANQRLREQKQDYLFYRLLDSQVDQYFIVLEGVGEKIDLTESHIISQPSHQHARLIYRMKRQMLQLRKAIWPMREVVSHLTQLDEKFISKFTRLYLRDVYDHTMQTIDTVETYRDITSSMMDIYLSSLTNRLNEVMKTLTVISTIFIPITFVASFYGMNFKNMPELHWQYGYPVTASIMLSIAIFMLGYFKWKKWF